MANSMPKMDPQVYICGFRYGLICRWAIPYLLVSSFIVPVRKQPQQSLILTPISIHVSYVASDDSHLLRQKKIPQPSNVTMEHYVQGTQRHTILVCNKHSEVQEWVWLQASRISLQKAGYQDGKIRIHICICICICICIYV